MSVLAYSSRWSTASTWRRHCLAIDCAVATLDAEAAQGCLPAPPAAGPGSAAAGGTPTAPRLSRTAAVTAAAPLAPPP